MFGRIDEATENVWERSFGLNSCVDAQTPLFHRVELLLVILQAWSRSCDRLLSLPCICCMGHAIRVEGSALDIAALSLHAHLNAVCAWTPSSIRVLCNRTSTLGEIAGSDIYSQAFPFFLLGSGPASPFLYSLVRPIPPGPGPPLPFLLAGSLAFLFSPFWLGLAFPLLGRGLANPDPKGRPQPDGPNPTRADPYPREGGPKPNTKQEGPTPTQECEGHFYTYICICYFVS